MKVCIPATYKDIIKENHPYAVNDFFVGGIIGCPCEWFEGVEPCNCTDVVFCTDCWDRLYKGERLVENTQYSSQMVEQILNPDKGYPAYELVKTFVEIPKCDGECNQTDIDGFFKSILLNPAENLIIPINWKELGYSSIENCCDSFRNAIRRKNNYSNIFKIIRHTNKLYLIKGKKIFNSETEEV